MCFPFRRRGAAIAGVISLLSVASLPRGASAGIVTPTEAETTAKPASSQTSAPHERAIALPSPVTRDPQQFWYPGMSDSSGVDSISLSNVPVQTPDFASAGTLAGAQQHPLIPLPMPAWTGMAGLLGLAAVKVARNYRKLLT